MQHMSLLCSKRDRAMWCQKTCRIQQYDPYSSCVSYQAPQVLDFQMRHRNIQARTQQFAQMGGNASLAGKMAVGKLIM